MNNNLDYLNKEEVNSFVYSSVNADVIECKNVVIDGRRYTKWGKYQTVTFFGIMYKTKNKDTNKTSYCIHVGISKQHPHDIVNDKKAAIEAARMNAITNPSMMYYNVSPTFDCYTFKKMMEMYFYTMDLEFVLTKDELKKLEDKKFNKDWDFYLQKKN